MTAEAQQVRSRKLRDATEQDFDIVVIGGGIHGACACREAALRGYRSLLLEANDFAFGTSSRCSKLLHGGVRYLEQGNVLLVREALQERARMLHLARHLARPQRIYFPILPGLTRPAWQIAIGLSLYDLLAQAFGEAGRASRCFKLHKRVSPSSAKLEAITSMGLHPKAVFSYFDGQMDDTRVVIENIVDSSKQGATTLNYAHVEAVEDRGGRESRWSIQWRDRLSGELYQSRASYLINASGPWVPELHKKIIEWKSNWPKPVYSRGVHLVFNTPWPAPGLILPTGTKGRYYFVLPYFSPNGSATFVGTTDRSVSENEADPQATQSEIDELLAFLKRDLPEAALNKDTLVQSLCGMRILAGSRGGDGTLKVSDVSRSEFFPESEGYIALLGGKYTTARATAEKMLNKADRFFAKKRGREEMSTFSRTIQLPGAEGWSEPACRKLVEELYTDLMGEKKPSTNECVENSPKPARGLMEEIEAAVRRFGMRARAFVEKQPQASDEKEALELLWRRQIRLAILEEQSATINDVLHGRFGFDDFPAEKQPLVDLCAELLCELTGRSEEELRQESIKAV